MKMVRQGSLPITSGVQRVSLDGAAGSSSRAGSECATESAAVPCRKRKEAQRWPFAIRMVLSGARQRRHQARSQADEIIINSTNRQL